MYVEMCKCSSNNLENIKGTCMSITIKVIRKKANNEKNYSEINIIADLIIEEYRFMHSYASVVDKIFAEEKKKYISTYNFHKNKLAELIKKINLKIQSYDGFDYNDGLPVTPLNCEEFTAEDELIIEQTIEPTILSVNGDVIRVGTVILAKKPYTTNTNNTNNI